MPQSHAAARCSCTQGSHFQQVDAAELLLRNGACTYLSEHFQPTADHYLVYVPPNKFHDIITLFQNAPRAALTRLRPLWGTDSSKNETLLSLAVDFRHVQAVGAFPSYFDHFYSAEQLSYALEHAVANWDAVVCDMIIREASRSLHSPSNPFVHIADATLYGIPGAYRAEALDATIKVLLSYGFDINDHRPDNKGQPWTAMCSAVLVADDEHVLESALLKHGAFLEQRPTRGSDGFTVLEFAISAVKNSDNEGCVRWLLTQGAPFIILRRLEDGSNVTEDPLHYACLANACGAAKAILDCPEADVNLVFQGQTPLHLVCKTDAVKMAEILLQHGADVSAIETKMGSTPLEVAVMCGSIDVVKLFLAKDLPVPRSILALGVIYSTPEHARILQLLIQHPPLQEPETLGKLDKHGRTILELAINHGKYEFAFKLLKIFANTANPHYLQCAWEALAYHFRHTQPYSAGDPQQIRQYNALLQVFVEHFKLQNLVEVPDKWGLTPLSQACGAGSVGAVKALLNAGALASTVDRKGNTPLTAALLCIFVIGSFEDWPTD